MDAITINDIGEFAKLITTIIGGISAISGVIVLALKNYLKPIQTDLDSIKSDINQQKLDIDTIKSKVNRMDEQYNELNKKALSNRQLDSLLVKTMLILIDENDSEQQALKTEIDNFLIHEAVN